VEQKQEQSVVLTPKQARAVIALQFEREEIVRQANEQIAEIMEAFQEQGRMLAMLHELPHGEGWTYQFQSVEHEDKPRIKLTANPPTSESDSALEEEKQNHDS